MDTTIVETKVMKKTATKKVFPASCLNSSAQMARNVFRNTKSATTGTSAATSPMRRIAISLRATADNSGAKMHFVSLRGGDAMDIRTAPTGQTRRIVQLSPAPIINSTAPRVVKMARLNALTKISSVTESLIATTALTRKTLVPTVFALLSDVSLNAEARLKEALVPVQLARRLEMTQDLVSIEMSAKNGTSATKSATIMMEGSSAPVSRVMSWKIEPIVKQNYPTRR